MDNAYLLLSVAIFISKFSRVNPDLDLIHLSRKL